ncbi:MAG: hypothetical protein WBI55_02235 [Eubacteriales bacterium]|jgi:hypothetical protein|nr:hypothetical protein [Clostridiales bacterium]
MGQKSFAFAALTTNDAFDALGIEGNYSLIKIYGEYGADMNKLTHELEKLSSVPYMMFTNFVSKVAEYKEFNRLVAIFSITLLGMMVFAAVTLLSSQLYIKTRLSLPTYALYRVNGLSLCSVGLTYFLEIIGAYIVGAVLSLPFTYILLRYAIDLSDALIKKFYPITTALHILFFVLLLTALSVIPSAMLLYRRRDNVVMDIL